MDFINEEKLQAAGEDLIVKMQAAVEALIVKARTEFEGVVNDALDRLNGATVNLPARVPGPKGPNAA